jgi:nucleolar protein 53
LLRSEEIIAQRSKVKAVLSRKRPADKPTNAIIETKRLRANYVPHKEIARLRKVADGHHEQTVAVQDAGYDIWDVQPEKANEKLTFLPADVVAKSPETLRHEPVTLAANGKPIQAVPKVSGGYSYNPAFADYQERYHQEWARAEDMERQRLVREEAERQKMEAVARSGALADAAERREELSEWDEDSEWEGFQSGMEEEKLSAKKPQRKTRAQRNKIKRRKEGERRAKHEAALKRKNDQVYAVKKYTREVAEREVGSATGGTKVESSESEDEGDENELRRRPLGKARLPEKDLELVLPSELDDSLRRLKPEGSLMKDRYRSLIVRGRMEARRRIPFRKQARGKLTEKWTFKDFIVH